MNKRYWQKSWSRFAFWTYVVGIAGFYAILWGRTIPRKEDRVKLLPRGQAISDILPKGLEGSEKAQPLVSIIVPARNEERNIRRCVQSLLEQDYENYEVIVVDDGSHDKTDQIVDELAQTHLNGKRLWVLRLRDELPAGWAGKPHAIHSGVLESNGDWLLFTDADTWHAPNALRSAITQALDEHADLFTLASTQELPTFWDRVLMPMAFMGISMLYPPRLVNDPASPVAIANGQYILIRREVYERLDGYNRPEMRSTLLDDLDLARLVKAHGYRLHFVDGQDLVRVHMYQNFSDIWRGWRKNAYLGNRGGVAFVALQLIGLPAVSIVPFLFPFLAKLVRTGQEGDISRLERTLGTTVGLVPLLAYRLWLNRQLGVSWYYVLTHALAGAVFTGILGQSTWRVLTKRGVDWRGRQYHNGNAKGA
jgi:chlorobactene glucosyltransferase